MWGGRASVSIKVRCQDFRERGSSPGWAFLRLFSANVGLVSADVKKFPRARGWGFAQVSSKSGKNTSAMVRRRFVNPCS